MDRGICERIPLERDIACCPRLFMNIKIMYFFFCIELKTCKHKCLYLGIADLIADTSYNCGFNIITCITGNDRKAPDAFTQTCSGTGFMMPVKKQIHEPVHM